MLVIRSLQLDALSAARASATVDALVAEVARFWPQTYGALGPAAVRARVERAVERARSYKLDAMGDIGRYVNTTFALGEGFEDEEQYPWAVLILQAPIASKVKMDKICARTADSLAAGVAGG